MRVREDWSASLEIVAALQAAALCTTTPLYFYVELPFFPFFSIIHVCTYAFTVLRLTSAALEDLPRESCMKSHPLQNRTSANPEVPGSDQQMVIPEKHPLATSWTFYYLDPDEARRDWQNANKDVLAFNTVEDFWAWDSKISSKTPDWFGARFWLFADSTITWHL